MSRRFWIGTGWIAFILLALTASHTLWRDLGYEVKPGTEFAFDDTWGASAGTMGNNCLAPAFGHTRVVEVGRVWVTLENTKGYTWSWTELPPCHRFQRTRHWVRSNADKQPELKKMIEEFERSSSAVNSELERSP